MKRSDVFEPLEPPPHGWTRMKARLEERRRPRWPLALAAGAAVFLAVVLQQPRVDVTAELRRSPSAGAFGLKVSSEALTLKDGASQQLPSSDENVLLYRVAVVSPSEAPPSE